MPLSYPSINQTVLDASPKSVLLFKLRPVHCLFLLGKRSKKEKEQEEKWKKRLSFAPHDVWAARFHRSVAIGIEDFTVLIMLTKGRRVSLNVFEEDGHDRWILEECRKDGARYWADGKSELTELFRRTLKIQFSLAWLIWSGCSTTGSRCSFGYALFMKATRVIL